MPSLTVTIKSNDNSTTLWTQSFSGSDSSTISVTSTGATITASGGGTGTYTYAGTKKFIGLSNTPNETEPDHGAEATFYSTGGTYYIVESSLADYRPLTYVDSKIQVDSAIRDGNGVRIDTNYQRKPVVYERTTNSSTSTTCTLIQFNASDYKANGYLAHFRFRVRSKLQDAYPSDNEFIINYSYRTATIVALNCKSSTSYDIVQNIYAYYPSSSSYLDTGNYFIAFTTGRASTNFIIEMIEADVPYTIPATMSASTTTNTIYQSLTPGNYSSTYPLMWTGQAVGNINGGSAYSSYAYGTKLKYFRVGESDTNRIMAVDHTGVAYRINTSTKKFPLPISMYYGTGTSANETTGEGCASTRSVSTSYLTSSSYNGFTMPTLTASDGGKTLYIRGSLDADGYFVCDGNVTLSMEAGYTYIPFGTLDPRYSGTTAQVPIQLSFNATSVPAYTLDVNGKLTHIDGKEVGGGGTYTLTDVQATFGLQATPDYSEFPYCAEVTAIGCTPNSYASVTYSNEQSQSLMYSPTAVTDTGKVKLYARQNVGTVTIPSIAIGIEVPEFDDAQPISSPIETRNLTLISSTDTEYTGFPYKYSFPCVGATATRTADVTFDVIDATSGNFAPVCETGAGVIYIWARSSQSSANIGYMLYYTDNVTVVSGTAGSDTKPIKIVNGQPVAVANDLAVNSSVVHLSGTEWITGDKVFQAQVQKRSPSGPDIQLLSTDLKVTNNTSQWTSFGCVRFFDQNGQHYAVVEGNQAGDVRGIYFNLSTSRTQGSDMWLGKAMGVWSNAEGAYWCDHPRKTWDVVWEGASTSGTITSTNMPFATNNHTWLILRMGRNSTSEVWAYSYYFYPLNKWDGAFPMYCGAADGGNGIYMNIFPINNVSFNFDCTRSFLSGVYLI